MEGKTPTRISGIFMLSFVAIGAIAALPTLLESLKEAPADGVKSVVQGKWMPKFEHHFTENYPVYDKSRNGWGTADYALFKEGRNGVLIGEEGWLFSTEEFTYARNREAVIET